MEIERKYLITQPIPIDLSTCKLRFIEQAYLNTDPVVRIRQDNDNYYLTYKSKGFLAREEYNLPLDAKSYEHLKTKADGIVITKKRYEIPFMNKYTIELDVFLGTYEGLILAEVEFETKEEANTFTPPDWFGNDVTYESKYHNSTMSKG